MDTHKTIKTCRSLAVFVLLFSPVNYSADTFAAVYKYQDANGRWQFSDKPPKDKKTKIETLEFEAAPENPFELKFDYRIHNKQHIADVLNPFHIPIEIQVSFEEYSQLDTTLIVPSNSRETIYSGAAPTPHFTYRYVWGDPAKKPSVANYRLPVRSPSKHYISQSFHGQFSHHTQPSLYAVDLALPIGTDIVAAREGTVIHVKDDYAFGGARTYFLDKANTVSVLHEDGSYATYAHLLMGSAAVKAGQTVAAGDVLGQSGTSGYSTGPHLHFVIRKNAGFKTESIAFKFEDARGAFTPQRKQKICPCP